MNQASKRSVEAWRHRRAVIVVTSAVVAVLVLAYLFDSVFTPLALALALAYILNPIVRWSRRRGIPRAVTAVLLFVFLLGVVVAVALFVVPPLVGELYNFGVSVIGEPSADGEPGFTDLNGNGRHDPGYLTLLLERVQELAERARSGEGTWLDRVLAATELSADTKEEVLKGTLNALRTVGTRFLSFLWGVQGLVFQASLTAVYLYFFLVNFDRIVAAVRARLPGRHRKRVEEVVGKIDAAVSAFMRGRILVCLVVGGLTALGLAVLGVPYWFLIGVATGLAGIVPYLPIFVGLVPAVLVAWFDAYSGWVVLGSVGVFVVVQTLEGWVLTPFIQGRAVGLHPVTLMVALLLGWEMLGLFGVILAVPLAATGKILAKEFLLPEVEALAHEKPDGGAQAG